MYENIFKSIKIRDLEIKNRIVFAPTSMGYNEEEIVNKFINIAKGGTGLIIIGDISVRSSFHGGIKTLENDKNIEYFKNITDEVHKYGCKVSAQLFHPEYDVDYIVSLMRSNKGSREELRRELKENTINYINNLSKEKINEIQEAYVKAAIRAEKAGFDMIQIHGDRLLGSFSSSIFNKREDAFGIIDAGILNTSTELINWSNEMNAKGARIFSKEAQHYQMRDPITGKKIKVTTTYFLATKLPTHFKQIGRHIPFTGEDYAMLSGHIKNTLLPVVDADDTDLKEILVDNRVNYYEAIGENSFIRGVQHTSQPIWSDLSEENNMHVLLKMKREIEAMVASLAYDFSEAEDRRLFTESADRLLSQYKSMCRSASVRFDATAFEEQRSIIHCYLEVVFKSMVKTGIIEIDINPRV